MADVREQRVRSIYEAFNRHDVDAVFELTVTDCVMDWSRSIGPNKGVFVGRDGLRAWMATMWDAFESFEVTPLGFVPAGDCLVTPTRVVGRGRGSGATVEAGGATMWEFEAGKVSRFTLYQDESAAVAAAGAAT